jgi:hypothetical protein
MSTRFRLTCCAACLLGSFIAACSQTIPTEQWQKFSSEVAGLSVLLPGEPRESLTETQGSAFYRQDVKVYSVSTGSNAGMFSVVERLYPQPLDAKQDVSSNLDKFQDFAAKNLHARVVKEKEITLPGMYGRRISLSFEIAGTVSVIEQMLVIKGARSFQLMAMSGSVPLADSDFERFFSSFTVTGEAREWKRSRSDPNAVVENNEPEPPQVTGFVTAFQCPAYPPSAKKIRLQGMVNIQVATDGGKIVDLKVSGHPLLAQAAEENVRTWKLADNAPKSFAVNYSYVFDGEYEPDPVYKCRAKLQLPDKVEVSTSW